MLLTTKVWGWRANILLWLRSRETRENPSSIE